MDKAETAPETGEVDEQVCLVGLNEELEEPECEITELDEKEINWIEERFDN